MLPTQQLPAPDFDPVAGLPELAAIRQAAASADWRAVHAAFAPIGDEHGRVVAARILAEAPGAELLLLQAVEQYPGDPLAAVLLAGCHIHLGWEARTGARASKVTPAQWAVFRDRLNQAERLLIKVTAHLPEYALAWVMRLDTARGLSLGLSEARRRRRRLDQVAPHHFVGQSRLLQQLLPKWGGSWEEAYSFARDSFQAGPPGSLSGALLAEYHVEQWLELNAAARREYVHRPQVRQELAQAAAGSVLHPDCRARYGLITAHGTFAMLASLAEDHATAAVHFRAMGPYGSTYPWGYLGDSAETLAEHRDRALAKG
ncbi:hypothetical protein [Kitasatospora sp. GP82]|uniref:hypothetical protein n=1 Tax=Kitasatospora sp. GP82 TaxID=3035089 RepID=UPI00247585C1|nr:hypothetical protein [Kitasatospora sp. GP82]MDH6125188.1 hypothetical protein [Kitasatospora sp. GP82]